MKQNKRWDIAKVEARLKSALSEALHISETIASVLINRGIKNKEDATRFLAVQEQPFHDSFLLKDMKVAVERIIKAIEQREKITVYGDYDVDGITASALLVRVLTDLNADVRYYIPERQSEGYGLNTKAVEGIIADGTRLLITVDCGISANAEIAAVNDKIDIIITDHHCPSETLPIAFAIINPKQLDCSYPNKDLAGVGVAYKLCQALWLTIKGVPLTDYLEIVALGTIADIVPLLGENRLIVKLGLEALHRTNNLGLRALVSQCGLHDKAIDSGRVGFVLAPRLNAAGRLDSALIGVNLLLMKDQGEAESIAERLELENRQRQLIEKQILVKAEAYLDTVDIAAEKVLVIAGEDWHSGVIGIVASRLVDKYYKPVVVISEKDGIGKGSCRSIRGFDMHSALTKCSDLLEQFGGHAQAAGLSIIPKNISLLHDRLTEIANIQLTEDDYIPTLPIEAIMNLQEVNLDFLTQLACLEPYGMGNPRPVFACVGAGIFDLRTMGQENNHLRFKVKQGDQTTGGLAWNMGKIIDELKKAQQIDFAFQPEINEWQGKCTIQLKAQDFRSHQKVITEVDRLFLADKEVDSYQNIGESEQFFTKIVGVTFENRQDLIAQLTLGQKITFKRQPENTYDANAVAVCTLDYQILGYLKAEIAQKLASLMDTGTIYNVQVALLTGSAEQNWGVNILVCKEQNTPRSEYKHASITLEEVRQVLLGARKYHPSQTEALKSLAECKNSLVIMGTGRGKSAIFQTQAAMVAINQRKMTVIIYPLRALVNDQFINLQRMMKPLGVAVFKGNGTLTTGERAILFDALQNETVDILLTTPEFMEAHLPALNIAKQRVDLVVIDECHHIAAASKRPAYQRLGKLIKQLGNPLVLGVTATADRQAVAMIKEMLGIDQVIIDPTIRENLMICDARNSTDKFSYIQSVIKQGEKVLIFVNSRKKAVEIAGALRESYPALSEKIGFYHAGLSNDWRVKVEAWFKDNTLQVVVATSAFGEGIDLPDIRHIVQYHLPLNLTTFNQQCGRVGRDGRKSLVHLLFGQNDSKLNQLILAERSPKRETIGRVYLVLKANHREEEGISLSNSQIAELVYKQYHEFISELGVSVCLKILEELGLLTRENFNGKRKIYFNEVPKVKLNLQQSSTFVEGINECEEFVKFSAEVMCAEKEILLTCINKPIYPI